MSVQATTWVWEHSKAEGTDRLVLLAIADAANRDGERSCQSVTTIMRMARVSKSTVKRSLHALQELGELEHTGTDGEYQTKVYRLAGMSPRGVQDDPQLGGVQIEPGSTQNKGGGPSRDSVPSITPENITPSSTSSVADAPERPEVISLLDHLDQRIRENGARVPSRTKKNLDAARLLLDRDGYTPEQVHWMIDWATRDEFWRGNILSLSKLREKFDTLKLRAGVGPLVNRATTTTKMQQTLDLAAQLQAEHDARHTED